MFLSHKNQGKPISFFQVSEIREKCPAIRSENCRKWVLANWHSRNWELYSSRLHTESYNTPHWSDRQTGFPRIL